MKLDDWRVRTFLLSCLIVAPFLKFLAQNEYGFFHAEVLVDVLWLLVPCLLLGRLLRGRAFYIVTGICIVLTGTFPLVQVLKPFLNLGLWQGAILLATGSAAALFAMRAKFFPVMAVFAGSGVAIAMAGHALSKETGRADRIPGNRPQVLWLLLDEQIGLAGFPSYPACDIARTKLTETLEKYNFTLYPYAYSNYAGTIDSVPSLLNGRLLRRPEELIEQTGEGNLRWYQARANSAFDGFAGEGYHVIGYQHASLRMCDASFGAAECRDYRDQLGRLHQAPGDWKQRSAWLVGSYQASDPWLGRVRSFFPIRCQLRMTGPLGVEDLWPDRLASEILSAQRQTFFFVHLLTPHSPYLYKPDGSIRPLNQWSEDRADERLNPSAYEERYCRYCEQVQFLAAQLDGFLQRLEQAGALNRMIVLIHGDHGSRIRRILNPRSPEEEPENQDAESLDYVTAPPMRDLLDRFSTLLAVRPPESRAPAISAEKHSLLTLVTRFLYQHDPSDGVERADRVYLFDREDRYQPIDILESWRGQ
jgi:Sulfatase